VQLFESLINLSSKYKKKRKEVLRKKGNTEERKRFFREMGGMGRE